MSASDPYQPIDCDRHDYLEVACLKRWRLLIELADGRCLTARALDTETTASKEEFLVVSADDGEHRLRLDRVLAITPQETNASFGRVRIARS